MTTEEKRRLERLTLRSIRDMVRRRLAPKGEAPDNVKRLALGVDVTLITTPADLPDSYYVTSDIGHSAHLVYYLEHGSPRLIREGRKLAAELIVSTWLTVTRLS